LLPEEPSPEMSLLNVPWTMDSGKSKGKGKGKVIPVL
jgi:hypothetical protein